MIETVPNFSEGRDAAVLDALRDSFRVPGLTLLDDSADPDHNRSVYTAAGTPEGVEEGIMRAVRCARDRIDLTHHRGQHPRIGAADVVPLVPLGDTTMEACVQLAHRLGKRIWEELGIPVYLYEEAATRPQCRNLSDVRSGGFEGLPGKMRNPVWKPDFGGCAPHPTAGAVALGARVPLIAYNFLLDTADIRIAKEIASVIREKNGGLPCVKALGMDLPGRGAQVSVNLTDYRRTGLCPVYRAVAREAEKRGTRIRSSELIGLVPAAALQEAAAEWLQMEHFTSDRVLENRLRKAEEEQEQWN